MLITDLTPSFFTYITFPFMWGRKSFKQCVWEVDKQHPQVIWLHFTTNPNSNRLNKSTPRFPNILMSVFTWKKAVFAAYIDSSVLNMKKLNITKAERNSCRCWMLEEQLAKKKESDSK